MVGWGVYLMFLGDEVGGVPCGYCLCVVVGFLLLVGWVLRRRLCLRVVASPYRNRRTPSDRCVYAIAFQAGPVASRQTIV